MRSALGAWLVVASALAQGQTPPAPQFGQYTSPDGQTLDLEWHLPAGEATALVTLQHGFARRCANLRTLARTLAEAGFATLCVNAEMAGGAPALAQALARDVATAGSLPDGRARPRRVVAAGHSAGGLFAVHLAAALVAQATARAPVQTAEQTAAQTPAGLAGVLLFDPVGRAGLAASLRALREARTPVLALLAPPARCNLQQAARPLLEAAAAAVIDVPDGTHVDAEGPDTETVAVWACREGAPRAAAVQRVQAEALAFVRRALSAPSGASSPQRP